MTRSHWAAALAIGVSGLSSVDAGAWDRTHGTPGTPGALRSVGVLIDSFTDSGPTLTYTDGGLDRRTMSGPGILGVERDMGISGTRDEAASLAVTDGLLDYRVTEGNPSQPDLFMVWDGTGDVIEDVDVDGLGSQNLMEGGATAFHLLGVTTTHATILLVSVFETRGNIGFGSVVVEAGANDVDIMIPFSSFTASPNFRNIGAVGLSIGFSSAPAPARVQLDEFNTVGATVAAGSSSWGRIKALYR